MKNLAARMALICGLAVLSACGSDSPTSTVDTSNARGTLVENPPLRVGSVSAADFAGLLAQTLGADKATQLLTLAGQPVCGVDVHYFHYWTVGAKGEATTASGALMMPTAVPGDATQAAACTGKRPIVLYAHGTQVDRSANLADIQHSSEGGLIATMFAAQGYIVVAPNYTGYDTSTLGYHPYLNADAQSKDMIDALAAARKALPKTFAAAATDSGVLFISGYSQGGHVALATQRALEAAGQPVAASVPMSGPYAMLDFGDAIFFGAVDIGATVFTPMLATSYQEAYGNLYASPADIFEDAFAPTIEGLLPSTTPLSDLFGTKIPQSALFDIVQPDTGNPVVNGLLAANLGTYSYGYGAVHLVKNAYRLAYLGDALVNGAAPQNTLRQAFLANDMRAWVPPGGTAGHWTPSAPVLMCGGGKDPTVFFPVNTGAMETYWAGEMQFPINPVFNLVNVLDLEGTPGGVTDPFNDLKFGFQGEEGLITDPNTYYTTYHTNVAPFCTRAARGFFDGIFHALGF